MRPIDGDELKKVVQADINRCYQMGIGAVGPLCQFLEQIDAQPTIFNNEKTIKEVFDNLTDEQKAFVNALVCQCLEEKKPETCRERLMREHPSAIKPDGRCKLCPYTYGYLPKDTPCVYKANGYVNCNACWDRPVEEVNR